MANLLTHMLPQPTFRLWRQAPLYRQTLILTAATLGAVLFIADVPPPPPAPHNPGSWRRDGLPFAPKPPPPPGHSVLKDQPASPTHPATPIAPTPLAPVPVQPPQVASPLKAATPAAVPKKIAPMTPMDAGADIKIIGEDKENINRNDFGVLKRAP